MNEYAHTEIGDIKTINGISHKCHKIEIEDCISYCLFEPCEKIIKIEKIKKLPKSKYHFNWRKIRKAIIQEEKVCQKCEASKYLDVHHKDKNRSNNKRENLITLCAFCHSKEEGHEGYKNVLKKRLSWERKQEKLPFLVGLLI